MSTGPITQTIDLLEQELDAIDQRRGEIEKAIEILRPMADGLDATHRDAHAVPAERRAPARLSSVADTDRRDKIRKLLSLGPMSTREIAKALRLDRKIAKMALQRAAKVGMLEGVGHGPGRKWRLTGAPVKEAP